MAYTCMQKLIIFLYQIGKDNFSSAFLCLVFIRQEHDQIRIVQTDKLVHSPLV